jgi:hypothetical protein
VTVAGTRLIAVMLLLVFTGMPAASVLCARECTAAAQRSASSDAVEHCHEADPADTVTLGGVASDNCDLLVFRDVATRERGAAPLLNASPLLTPLHHASIALGRASRLSTNASAAPDACRSALAPGAPLPLRI